MKALFPILGAVLLAAGATLSAQDEPAAKARPVPLIEPAHMNEAAKEAQLRFSSKDAATKEKFAELMQTVRERMAQKRTQEALEALNEAEVIWPEYPELLNLKGASLVNLRDFDRAAEYFTKAMEMYPAFWQSKFNLAEMYFVRGNFKRSLELYNGLLEDFKREDVQLDSVTRRIVDFKIILNHIKLGQAKTADELIANYDLFDDTPIYYYSKAAVHFQAKEEAKAQEWIMKARSVYAPQVNNIFEDSLIELDWMFNF